MQFVVILLSFGSVFVGWVVDSGRHIPRLLKQTNSKSVHFIEIYTFFLFFLGVVETYYTLFDVDNLRIGFACQNTNNGDDDGGGGGGSVCDGGGWNGVGGYLISQDSESWWEKMVLLSSIR